MSAMSIENKKAKVIAIGCSDIHLSITPPIARSEEDDWFESMAQPLSEIRELAEKYDCPVLCAGDVFHTWRSSPELINFALENLPDMYAIPGQHDMPLHSYEEMHKSAFHTLVLAKKIKTVPPGGVCINEFFVYGFPWGAPVTPPNKKGIAHVKIALVHEYTWIDGAGFPGARAEAKPTPEKYKGFDVVLIGDNHIPWSMRFPLTKTQLINCGSLMRRNTDQRFHKPCIYLIRADGTTDSVFLDTSKEKFVSTEVVKVKETSEEIQSFLENLASLHSLPLDFIETLKQVMDKSKTPVQKILMGIIKNEL